MTDKVIEKISSFFERAAVETSCIQEKLQLSIKLKENELEYGLLAEYKPVRSVSLYKDVLETKKFLDFLGIGAICEMVISKNFEKYAKKFQSEIDKISFVIFKKDGRFLVFVYCGNQVKMLSENFNSLPIDEFISVGMPINI